MQIEAGQPYTRKVWRPEKSHQLHVLVEHQDERDCPWEEIESFITPAAQPVTMQVEMVLTNRLVGKVSRDGETIFETVSFVETRIAASEEDESDYDVHHDTSNDEIPF